jgi:hypothetical protein
MSDSNYANTNFNLQGAANDFLSSNSMISNVAFIVLVVFAFILILNFSIMAIYSFYKPSETPKLIDGMIEGNQMLIIKQDPASGGTTILRSKNEDDGIEFTWSIWLYIDETDDYDTTQYKHIFHKGDDSLTTTGLNFPSNAPGLYIKPKDATNLQHVLLVKMNTFNEVAEEIEINNIPNRKWVNVVIICKNHHLDVYINGTVAKRYILNGVPKQNYGDVYVAMNGGFNGKISNLWYYNYAIGTKEINDINGAGANTKVATTSGLNTATVPNYTPLSYYFGGDANSA